MKMTADSNPSQNRSGIRLIVMNAHLDSKPKKRPKNQGGADQEATGKREARSKVAIIGLEYFQAVRDSPITTSWNY